MRLIMTNNKMIMQVHLMIWVVLMMIFHKIMVHKWVIAKIWEAVNNLHHPFIDPDKPAKVVFLDFADSSVNLKLLCWVDVLKQAYTEGDIRRCIYDTLNVNDIEMPFPKRDVYVKEVAK